MKKDVGKQILLKVGELLKKDGYKNITMRNVALSCNLAVSNIYNYFSSKEEMINVYFYHQWLLILSRIKKRLENDNKVLMIINDELSTYKNNNLEFFQDDANLEKFLEGLKCYEPSIMSQLSDLFLPLCLNSYIEDKQFMAETVVESIIHWVIDDDDITKQTELLSKVFSNSQTDFH